MNNKISYLTGNETLISGITNEAGYTISYFSAAFIRQSYEQFPFAYVEKKGLLSFAKREIFVTVFEIRGFFKMDLIELNPQFLNIINEK